MVLILGDMLFDRLPGLPPGEPVFMMEDWHLCTRVRHHQQKLVLFLSAMRHFRDRLRREGRTVRYVELGQDGDRSIWDRLRTELEGQSELVTYAVHDRPVRDGLAASCAELGIRFEERTSPMFLTSDAEWDDYARGAKRFRMADFYVWQRRRLGLLVDVDGRPFGGNWSYDAENRKALPRGHVPPPVWGVPPDEVTRQMIGLVARDFGGHPGRAVNFAWPVTHEEARAWLEEFVESRLDAFGDYEDALSARERTVHHSLLSPMLNTGLLTPAEVIRVVLDRHERRAIPLNSLEGGPLTPPTRSGDRQNRTDTPTVT